MKVSEWLEKHGYSQSDGARELHISPQQMHYLLNRSKACPRLDMAYRIFVFSRGEIKMTDLLPDHIVKMYETELAFDTAKTKALEGLTE